MTTHTPENSDLNWLAFRYAAGEMSEVECETFEQRLADDQSARDAVVRAVRLMESVAAGDVFAAKGLATKKAVREPMISGRRNSHSGSQTSRSVLVLASLCAAASVGFAIWSWSEPVGRGVRMRSQADVAANESLEPWFEVMTLWTAWNQTSAPDDASLASSNAALLKAETDMTADPVDTIEGMGESAEQEFEVPGWMIAALTPNGSSGPEDSGDVPLEN